MSNNLRSGLQASPLSPLHHSFVLCCFCFQTSSLSCPSWVSHGLSILGSWDCRCAQMAMLFHFGGLKTSVKMFGLSTPMMSQLLDCLNPTVVLFPLWVFLSCTPSSSTKNSPYFVFYHLVAIIFFCSFSIHSWMSAWQSQRDLAHPGALCLPCSPFHCQFHAGLKSFPRNLSCQPCSFTFLLSIHETKSMWAQIWDPCTCIWRTPNRWCCPSLICTDEGNLSGS